MTNSIFAAAVNAAQIQERERADWSPLALQLNDISLTALHRHDLSWHWAFPHKASCVCSGCRPSFCD